MEPLRALLESFGQNNSKTGTRPRSRRLAVSVDEKRQGKTPTQSARNASHRLIIAVQKRA